MAAPCAAVPLPGGRPLPSGPMLMSQSASSASLIGLPSPGRSAAFAAAAQPRQSPTDMATVKKCSAVNMLDLPVVVHRPARDHIHMPHWECRDRSVDLRLAALGEHLAAGRLHVASLVPRAALQHHRLTVPAPGHAKPRQSLAEHRFNKGGLCPEI